MRGKTWPYAQDNAAKFFSTLAYCTALYCTEYTMHILSFLFAALFSSPDKSTSLSSLF